MADSSLRAPPDSSLRAPLFAAGERVILEHGERSKRAQLTGATGLVIDGAVKCGWLRVRVRSAAPKWHQRHLRRVVSADVAQFERLTPDLLLLVLDRVGCHRSLAAAARTCWASSRPEPAVLNVLAAQAPKLRALDIGSVCPGAAETVTGLSAMRELEDLRALVATEGYQVGTLQVGRGLIEVIPTLPKLRRLELGGFDLASAIEIRSRSLESLDLRASGKSAFLTELRCPRLTQLIYDGSRGWYGGGPVPFIFATDLASRQTVRLSLFQLDLTKHDLRGITPDGFGFPVDDEFRERNPAYSHLRHAREVSAIWEFAPDYDGSGHATAAALCQYLHASNASSSSLFPSPRAAHSHPRPGRRIGVHAFPTMAGQIEVAVQTFPTMAGQSARIALAS
jgi:hypothetical protein